MIFKKMTVIFFIHFLLSGAVYAQEGRCEEPWATSGGAREDSLGENLSAGQRAADVLFGFFQTYISPVDGDRCPSYPTCSQYAREAVRKHGVLVGLVMTFDRLIHESDEIRVAPLVRVGESYRHYDPVENNDFWWDKDRNQRSAISGPLKK
jgi:putative component of membrane protein insertase Oxa1/YidC/SpoIIIJ protein YidD